MGRMLETMKLGDTRRAPVAISKPGEEKPPVVDCVTDWEIAEEVPFVEVGGPNRKVELSPGLSQHPPQAAPPPHLVAESARVFVTPAKPMAVAFEPWPGPAPSAMVVSPEVVAYHHPDHPTSKEYAALLQTMRGSLKSTQAGVLLLAGVKPGVGASTVLLNLAVLAAQEHKLRVMLVDANGTRPDLTQRLGKSATLGLHDVIDGAAAIEQTIVKTGIGALHVLPHGTAKPHAPLTAEAMSWLTACLRQRYDLILIDGPVADQAGLAVHVAHADGIYLVLPRGDKAPLHESAMQSLRRLGGRLCGMIHTHFEV